MHIGSNRVVFSLSRNSLHFTYSNCLNLYTCADRTFRLLLHGAVQHSDSIYCCIMIYLFIDLKTWARCGQDFPYPKELFLAHKKCGTLCATTLYSWAIKSSQIISLRPPESTQFLLFFSIRRLTSCYFSTIVSQRNNTHFPKEIFLDHKKCGTLCVLLLCIPEQTGNFLHHACLRVM
jgi:hypothetical protein